jgi:hypothetical protein
MFEQIKAAIKKSLESKRENDTKKLLSVIKNNPTKVLSAKDWNKILNRKFPKIIKGKLKNRPIPSTRRDLSGLEDNDVITRLGKKGARGVKYGFVVDEDIWYKKILKTGKTSNPLWKTGLKIEIYTFEKNDKCRFESLLSAVMNKVPELSYIDNAGYSSTRDNYEGEISPYQFESAHLVVQSTEDSDFFNGAVALEDTNEMPC